MLRAGALSKALSRAAAAEGRVGVRTVMVDSSFEMRDAVRQARLDVFGARTARQPATPRASTRRAKAGLKGDAIVDWSEARLQDYNLRGFDAEQARDKWIEEGAAKRLGTTTRSERQRPIKRSVGERILWQRGDATAGESKKSDSKDNDADEVAAAMADGDEDDLPAAMPAEEIEELESTVLAPLGKFMQAQFKVGHLIDNRRAPGVRMPSIGFDGARVLRSSTELLMAKPAPGTAEALAQAGRGPDGKRLDGKDTDDEWSDEAKAGEADEPTEEDAA